MVIIGLTGGIASGKSTVSEVLSELGAVVISADEVGHELLQPHTEAWQDVVATFGKEILEQNDAIDRSKLGSIVFHNPEALQQLNGIMHRRMSLLVEDKISELRQQGVEVVVLEAPLLIEANWTEFVDQVWVATAPEATVIKRLHNRNGLSEEEARARIRPQMPIEDKVKYADVVIDTDCDLAEVESRVLKLWRRLQLLKIGEAGLRKEIKEILTQREKKSITEKSLGAAAVLIPLYQRDGKWHILFTKRTENVEYHKGQISFPGGRWEEEDENLLITALRESFEEIGLQAEGVEILGELDDFVTLTSNFVVTPFVAVIPHPYEFKVSREEVEELIEVPLPTLLQRDNFREEPAAGEGQPPSYYYQYGGRIIWGATARILKQFLDLVFG